VVCACCCYPRRSRRGPSNSKDSKEKAKRKVAFLWKAVGPCACAAGALPLLPLLNPSHDPTHLIRN
jgi:hypothetical protein